MANIHSVQAFTGSREVVWLSQSCTIRMCLKNICFNRTRFKRWF